MSRCTWQSVDGVRYLMVELRGLTSDEALRVLQESADLVQAEEQPVVMLVDAGGAAFGSGFQSAVKRTARDVFEPRRTRAYLVGLPVVARLALEGMHRLGQARTQRALQDVPTALAAIVADHGSDVER